jgi:hypothetical protein
LLPPLLVEVAPGFGHSGGARAAPPTDGFASSALVVLGGQRGLDLAAQDAGLEPVVVVQPPSVLGYRRRDVLEPVEIPGCLAQPLPRLVLVAAADVIGTVRVLTLPELRVVATLAAPAGPSMTGLAFTILHQGASSDFFILCWWDGQIELPTRVHVRGPQGWRPAVGGESFCVWDLRVIWWEREAYVNTVLAGRPDAVGAYLAMVAEGYA